MECLHPWRHLKCDWARPGARCSSELLWTSLQTNMVWIWLYGFDHIPIHTHTDIHTYIYRERVSLKRYLTFIVSFSFKYAQILAKHWYYMFKVHSGTHENCILPYFTTCAKILAWTKLVSCYWNQWSWKAENEVRRRWDYCHHTCNKLFWLN